MKSSFQNSFIHEFFTGHNLLSTMIVLTNNYFHECQDALTQLPIIMLNHNVTISLNQNGLTPFLHIPKLIFHYTLMTKDQLKCISNALASMKADGVMLQHNMTTNGTTIQCIETSFRVDMAEVLICVHQMLRGGLRESARLGHEIAKWHHIVDIIEKRVYDSCVIPSAVMLKIQKFKSNGRDKHEKNE